MKILFIIFIMNTALAADQREFEVKACLASAYAAELAVYLENDYYSDKGELLDLDKHCDALIKEIKLSDNDEKYTIYAVSSDGKHRWMINEKKELRQSDK